ncbi:hypothetical protein D3229_07890 [Leucobacter aridicollis]|nr:hypothetical protein [Leucobacter aridicollis]
MALNSQRSATAAVMPDCVLDPGVLALSEDVPQAVLGITRLSAGFLAALGVKFGVITRNRVIADEYEATVRRYGIAHLFSGAYVMDLSVEDISNTVLWNARVSAIVATASADGVEVLINGCSAVEVTAAPGGVPVVDPTALALKVAELGVQEGLLGNVARK